MVLCACILREKTHVQIENKHMCLIWTWQGKNLYTFVITNMWLKKSKRKLDCFWLYYYLIHAKCSHILLLLLFSSYFVSYLFWLLIIIFAARFFIWSGDFFVSFIFVLSSVSPNRSSAVSICFFFVYIAAKEWVLLTADRSISAEMLNKTANTKLLYIVLHLFLTLKRNFSWVFCGYCCCCHYYYY